MGAPISIKAKLDFDEIVLFEGHIVRHKYKNSTQGTAPADHGQEQLVNMALSTQTEVFAKQSDKEVIEAIDSNMVARWRRATSPVSSS